MAAEAIGREADVDKLHAEVLPEDKVIVMDSPITKYGSAAMFGAPAVARASMGIAKGAAGSDAGIKTRIIKTRIWNR